MTQVTSGPIHLLTVNLHSLLREAIGVLLEQHSNLAMLPESPTCEAALSFDIGFLGEKPDLLLFNLDGCPHQHLECLSRLRGGVSPARLLIISDKRDIARFRAAIVQGAYGILMKTAGAGALIEAIHQIHQGRVWFDYEIISQLIPELRFTRPVRQDNSVPIEAAALTLREREIVALLCEGLRYQEIADRLGKCVATVRSQASSAILKLGLRDRAELIVYVYRHGLSPLPFQKAINRWEEPGLGREVEGVGKTLYLASRKLA